MHYAVKCSHFVCQVCMIFLDLSRLKPCDMINIYLILKVLVEHWVQSFSKHFGLIGFELVGTDVNFYIGVRCS